MRFLLDLGWRVWCHARVMDPELQALGVQLTESAIRNTAQVVADRISAAKARRDERHTIAELEQIVNDLIADKAEVSRIAQAFESELVAQRISDDDVAYITQSIVPVLQALVEQGGAGAQAGAQQTMDLLTPIISVETVTVLQLLGFNFRRAIGEPLTSLVSRAILARTAPDAATGAELQALQAKREIALVELARDADAYQRFGRLLGRE